MSQKPHANLLRRYWLFAGAALALGALTVLAPLLAG